MASDNSGSALPFNRDAAPGAPRPGSEPSGGPARLRGGLPPSPRRVFCAVSLLRCRSQSSLGRGAATGLSGKHRFSPSSASAPPNTAQGRLAATDSAHVLPVLSPPAFIPPALWTPLRHLSRAGAADCTHIFPFFVWTVAGMWCAVYWWSLLISPLRMPMTAVRTSICFEFWSSPTVSGLRTSFSTGWRNGTG